MVSIDKYIRKLLYEQNCVIIPGFGGLITHTIQAQFDSERNIYRPTRKRVAFNEVLSQDDGLLVHTVVSGEGIDRGKAQQVVNEYTRYLGLKLAEEGRCNMKGIGSFSRNAEGRLVFIPKEDSNFDVNWFGLNEVAASKHEFRVPVTSVEVPKEDFIAEESFTSVEMESFEPKRKWTRWGVAAASIGALVYFSTMYPISGTESMLSSLNPFSGIIDSMEPSRTEIKVQNESASTDEFHVADSLIREINGLADFKLEEEAMEQSTAPVENEVSESAPVNKPEEPVAQVPSAEKQLVKSSGSEKRDFHLVAGSFSTEILAAKLVRELKEKGYTDASVLEVKGKELVKVSARSYKSMSEAYNDRPELEKVVGKGVWVFRDR